jgi:choline dehydrogenase
MASVCQLRPESKGFVEIRGPSVFDEARVCFNYLASDVDRRVVGDGLSRLREIMNRPALARYIGEEVDSFPDRADDQEKVTYAGEVRGTAHHLMGSCSMGTNEDSVVDRFLRVRGIDHLRVIDASIIPSPVSGNTAAPTVMIAEKGADMVLQDVS